MAYGPPGTLDRVAVASDAAVAQHRPTNWRGSGPAARASRAARPTKSRQRGGSAAAGRGAREPGQSSLEGRAGAVELVAVERHAGLQSERIAGAEAAGQQAVARVRLAAGCSRPPDLVPGDEELEAVLTGVAGAGHPARGPRPRALRRRVASGSDSARSRSWSGGGRPRQRDPGPPAARSRTSSSSSSTAHPARRSASSAATTSRLEALGHHEEPLGSRAVHDEVVDDAAVRSAD